MPGTDRVLFIDDDKAICGMVERALERLGYAVAAFTDPGEALERFREAADDYDVVVTDEMMAGMRGSELLPGLRAIRPDVPVILCSGFAQALRGRPTSAYPFNAFVAKPMIVGELTGAIAKVRGVAAGGE